VELPELIEDTELIFDRPTKRPKITPIDSFDSFDFGQDKKKVKKPAEMVQLIDNATGGKKPKTLEEALRIAEESVAALKNKEEVGGDEGKSEIDLIK